MLAESEEIEEPTPSDQLNETLEENGEQSELEARILTQKSFEISQRSIKQEEEEEEVPSQNQSERPKEESVSFKNYSQDATPVVKEEEAVVNSEEIEDASLEREELARLERIAAEIVVKEEPASEQFVSPAKV